MQMAGCLRCGMPIDLDDPADSHKVRNGWFCAAEDTSCAEDFYARMDFLHSMGFFSAFEADAVIVVEFPEEN